MVLKAEAVRARLLRLEEVVSGLEGLTEQTRRGSGRSLRDAWAIERGLQLGAEIVFDVGDHILAAHFGVSAKDYEDIVRELGREGVIGDALAARLKGVGGFRNILVHEYLRLDPALVEAAFERAPRDYSDFAQAIRDWLDRLEP